MPWDFQQVTVQLPTASMSGIWWCHRWHVKLFSSSRRRITSLATLNNSKVPGLLPWHLLWKHAIYQSTKMSWILSWQKKSVGRCYGHLKEIVIHLHGFTINKVGEIQLHQIRTFRCANWYFIKSMNVYWEPVAWVSTSPMSVIDNSAEMFGESCHFSPSL